MSLKTTITKAFLALAVLPAFSNPIPLLPEKATLTLDENWSSGEIDSKTWYSLRKQWEEGNAGVVPENVSMVEDTLDGKPIQALRCEAHGDRYDGPIVGLQGETKRVGGVLVSKQHFASGRFQIVAKIGSKDAPRPKGMVPALWTYGFRIVKVDAALSDDFQATEPLYHPYLQKWLKGNCFYWSEIDFPEYGKAGEYQTPMYNTFLGSQKDSLTFDVGDASDGNYHTYTTDWRTHLVPLKGIKDSDVRESEGFYWVATKEVPFESTFGNPLKRLGKDDYAVYAGKTATHWIDGRFIGQNTKFVPCMSAQLNLGVWLPKWAGEADWKVSSIQIASVKVWQYGDPGDVLNFLTDDIEDNFKVDGSPIPPK